MVLVVGAVLSTPFLLRAVAPSDTDWGQLSDVSQTYGALSVLISAAALVGVAASLTYQARQTRVEQEESARSAHRELVLLSLGDPVLRTCWEPPGAEVTADEWRRLAFTNLIMARWENSFRLRRTTEEQLRRLLANHFRGAPARTHWAQAGHGWRLHAEAGGNRRARRFALLADECFHAAVARGAAVAPEDYFLPDTPP
ncbi:DUF6082 family protein [Streptomyces sp. NPDC049881]|uniref:DUF6082 family protein n=1 Tax=Streptomyces sp. NPDC049881 TaxID=3155778 RepID=UPI0034400B39